MKETTFWKTIAWSLGLLLIASLLINTLGPLKVPPQVTSLMLGCLVSIGVGYSVVCPRSSPIILTEVAENAVRKQQYVVGLVFSMVIALLFLLPGVRRVPLSWGLVPIILLAPFLIVREAIMRVRGDKSGPGRS